METTSARNLKSSLIVFKKTIDHLFYECIDVLGEFLQFKIRKIKKSAATFWRSLIWSGKLFDLAFNVLLTLKKCIYNYRRLKIQPLFDKFHKNIYLGLYFTSLKLWKVKMHEHFPLLIMISHQNPWYLMICGFFPSLPPFCFFVLDVWGKKGGYTWAHICCSVVVNKVQ